MASPLVYPRTLPSKVNSSYDGIDALDTDDPQVVDYLKITIYDSQKSSPYTYIGGSDAQGLYNQNTQSGSRGEAIVGTIYLYLPNNLSESYNTIYNESTLGAAGVAAIGGALGSQATAGDPISLLQQFAGSAKSEYAAGAAAAFLGTVNSGLGIEGSLTGQDLVALVSRKVFNPYQEVTFRGVNYREHSFTFNLTPKNLKESKECYSIVQALRTAMLPSLAGGATTEEDFKNIFSQQGNENISQTAKDLISKGLGSNSGTLAGARYLNIPNYFRLNVVRVEGNNVETAQEITTAGTLRSIMKFPTKMVLTGFDLNLTPDGQINTLKDLNNGYVDYGPASMELKLTFKETAFITRDMIQDS